MYAEFFKKFVSVYVIEKHVLFVINKDIAGWFKQKEQEYTDAASIASCIGFVVGALCGAGALLAVLLVVGAVK